MKSSPCSNCLDWIAEFMSRSPKKEKKMLPVKNPNTDQNREVEPKTCRLAFVDACKGKEITNIRAGNNEYVHDRRISSSLKLLTVSMKKDVTEKIVATNQIWVVALPVVCKTIGSVIAHQNNAAW